MKRQEVNGSDILNNVFVRFLRSCDLGMKNIVVVDITDTLSIFKVITKLEPLKSVSLLSNWSIIANQILYEEIVQVDGVIIVVDLDFDLDEMGLNFINKWSYKSNCSIFILPKQAFKCSDAWDILLLMRPLYLPATYYICLFNHNFVFIWTSNPYGDTKPRFWLQDTKFPFAGQNYTYYYRSISTKTCEGFNFERKHPKNETYIVIGVTKEFFSRRTNFRNNDILDEQIELYFKPEVLELINLLRKLMKVQFLYEYVRLADSSNFLSNAWISDSVDVIIYYQSHITNQLRWIFFHPIAYEEFSILSYNRGLKTPLEKIASFYGFWTLISLITFSALVFIVIWFKTNKSIHLAFFDVLRLLIDSGVNVPIDTLSLKIFFCVIFSYFLIIHATFSGHLAEFLTKSELRKNVESPEDLLNSEIKSIYNFGFKYENINGLEILHNKTIYLYDLYECPVRMANTSNSVCIGYKANFRNFRASRKDWNNTFYISEKVLYNTASAYIYRPSFPLREKMNLALMFLLETKILNHNENLKSIEHSTALEKQMKISEINFRLITIDDIKFAFIFLAIGNSLGLICFLCELYIDWCRKNRETGKWFSISRSKKDKAWVKITVRQKQ